MQDCWRDIINAPSFVSSFLITPPSHNTSYPNTPQVTDVGVLGIIENNSNLQLLSLAGCALITNKALKGIGKYCPHLTSVNFSLCVKVTNDGIKAVARNCPNLQVCNFAGILKLSEGSLVELASNCPGLLMLNVTGCEAITPNGLKALITGLKYVESGITFTGFKPKDQHVEQKLMDHMSFLRGHAIEIIKDGFDKHRLRKEARLQAELDRMERAATVIQQTYRRYGHRQFWYKIFLVKKRAKCATIIQSLWRGMKGRRKAYAAGTARRLFYSRTPQAVQIQRMVRGHSVRNANLSVTRAIVLMYSQRWQEAQVEMLCDLLLSIHPINPISEYTLSTQSLITPYQHTLSTRPVNPISYHTLSTHPINTPCQPNLLPHPINTPYQPRWPCTSACRPSVGGSSCTARYAAPLYSASFLPSLLAYLPIHTLSTHSITKFYPWPHTSPCQPPINAGSHPPRAAVPSSAG